MRSTRRGQSWPRRACACGRPRGGGRLRAALARVGPVGRLRGAALRPRGAAVPGEGGLTRAAPRGLFRKEFIQCFRTRPLVVLVVWTIAIEIAICGYAITHDVTHIALAVRDLDGSTASRELIARFAQTEYFDARFRPGSARELDDLLERGRATMGLVVPPDFSRQLGQGLSASVQLLLDGANSNSALIALGYADGIVGAYAREVGWRRLATAGERLAIASGVRNERRAWYNPALRSVDFEIVAMLTLGVMMIAVIVPAAGPAREKEAGTIDQLLVMPFRPWELMLGKVVPTFVVSLASLGLALWLPWWFGVPIRGSLLLFFALSALFLFSSLGLELLVGTLARNLQQALLLAFFVIFPLMVVSGTLAPVESMPAPVQLPSRLSPLRHYHEIGLGIFLKEVGIDTLWPDALAMAFLGAGLFGLGVWRFGTRLGRGTRRQP